MEHSSAPIRLEPLKPRRASLAELRERNGVSLDDIADRTRIPLHHLKELERGDVSRWPAGVYAKSWARDYANEAGIDPDEVTAFVAPVAEIEISTSEITKARNLRERLTARRSSSAAARLAGRMATVVIVLLLLAMAAVYVWKETEPVPAADPAGRPAGTSGVTPGPPR